MLRIAVVVKGTSQMRTGLDRAGYYTRGAVSANPKGDPNILYFATENPTKPSS